ncbi:hypothetical protein Tco_0507640 [Tanacetum coccineum]
MDKGPYPRDFPRILPWEKPVCVVVISCKLQDKKNERDEMRSLETRSKSVSDQENLEREREKEIQRKDKVDNAAQVSNATTIAPGIASYSACKYVKLIQEFLGYVRDTFLDIHKPSEKLVAISPINKKKTVRPTGRTFTLVGNASPLTRITATNKVPLREPIPLEVVAQESVVTKVYTRRPKIGNITILRVYYVEGLGHNLLFVGQFCDSDLEVAFRKHTCFVRNLEGVNLLLGSRETNLYTLSNGDMMASSPICLLSKASKTKS